MLFGESLGVIHIGTDAGETFEIAVDEPLCFGARDTQVARQTKARDAIDHAKVDRLGLTTHVRRHLVQWHAEHFRSGQRVNVDAVLKRLLKLGDIGDMRQYPQLDLGIVKRDQRLARLCDKCLADAPPFFGPDRDVLQVRIGRGQPPGRRPRDGIGRMHTARVGVDVILQRVSIGRFQLGHLSPVQHPRGQVMFCREVLKHIGTGGIGPRLAFLAAFQPHLVEQDFPQLLGRADVEFAPGELIDLVLKPRHLLGKGVGHPAQRIAVHLHARAFHCRQNRHKRAFKRFIHLRYPDAVELGFEQLPQPQSDIRILGGIFHRIGERHLIKGDGRFACPQQRLDRDRCMRQIAFRQRVHAVAVQPGVHRVGQQHRVVDGRDVDPKLSENLAVVFHVLPDLEDRGVLQHRG